MSAHSFLSEAEQSKFENTERNIPRSIVQQFPEEAAQPVSLVPHLLARSALHIKRTGAWFEGLVITVKPDDGMTWAAEQAVRGLLAQHPTLRLWLVSNKKSSHGLPVVAALLGPKRFLALAAKRDLTEPFLSWDSPKSIGLVVATLLLGMVARFL